MKASEALAKEFNRRTIRSAQRFVYAGYGSDVLDRVVQRHVDTAPRLVLRTFTKPGVDELLIHSRLEFGGQEQGGMVHKATMAASPVRPKRGRTRRRTRSRK